MTNYVSFELEKYVTLATLSWQPGILTSVMALATLWTFSAQTKFSTKKVIICENRGRKIWKK